MKTFMRFVRLIPQFYRLFRMNEYEPQDYEFILEQYSKVLVELTDGKLSKPRYYARDIISIVNDCYCENCDLKRDQQGEPDE